MGSSSPRRRPRALALASVLALAPVLALASILISCASPAAEPDPDPTPCIDGASADERGVCACDPGFRGDPSTECTPHPDVCAEAEQRRQHRVCAHQIEDDAQWMQLSLGGGPPLGGIRRLGKYLMPVDLSARLPTLFSDANSYRLHYCLMSAGFEPLFPGLTTAGHAELLLTHAGREFYAGSLYELETDEGEVRFGFTVETASRPEQMLPVDTIGRIHRELSDRFAVGELSYVPRGTLQEQTAARWADAPFDVLTQWGEDVLFEAYTTGVAYGRIRVHRPGDEVSYGWQDIVVFDEVPVALEGVLGGSITGQRQDVLSHLNVLAAQRGSPNVFVDDAVEAFESLEGQLVRLEAESNSYRVREAGEDEADLFWQRRRPAAAVLNPARFDYTELDAFADIPADTPAQRDLARSRFGAKTVGLATLRPLIAERYQTPGLGVPFHYYDRFMRENTWSVEQDGAPRTLSYAETIDAWLDDDAFRTDAVVRKERLAALREHMRTQGVVSSALVERLRARIAEEFGDETVMVRVRSSSNAEDTPTFNGAGLYDSTSACAADSAPGADPSVSACDPGKAARSLERGLARVWASQWNFGAFEERDYYQLDHRAIAMGATISRRFADELANGVAFTGSPVDARESRFTVNAQQGGLSVVNPSPGITAELSRLTLEDGEVVDIERVVSSSLVPPEGSVMDDPHLRELGRLMDQLRQAYPVDHAVEGARAPLLDLEFKRTRDDALVIKQIRTFLPTLRASEPTCRE